MAEDVMEQAWCCLTCSSRVRFGELLASDTLRCPKCHSPDLHPADGATVTAPEYNGVIGTRN